VKNLFIKFYYNLFYYNYIITCIFLLKLKKNIIFFFVFKYLNINYSIYILFIVNFIHLANNISLSNPLITPKSANLFMSYLNFN
jgi:hypothetical protein